MEEKKKNAGWDGSGAYEGSYPQKPATVGEQMKAALGGQAVLDHLFIASNPNAPPAKSARKKRRRVGQLNDGQWAPGYGPDAKKNRGKKTP